MTKRLLALLLAMLMCFAIFACDSKSKSNRDDDDDDDITSTVSENNNENNNESNNDNGNESNSENSDESNDESNNENNNENNQSGPLLYKVTDDSGNVVWLFGSIHIGREDYYPLPDYVMNAFNSSDVLAVEADIVAFEQDTDAQEAALMQFIYMDGSTITDHISAELYQELVNILTENNSYIPWLDLYKPYMWYNFISSFIMEKVEANSELGIDRYFINLANEKNVEIEEIESVDSQYAMFANFSDELMEIMLAAEIDSYNNISEAKEQYEVLLDLWASGDEAALREYLSEGDSEFDSAEDEALYNEYNNAMIVNRNKLMTDYADDALNSGEEVFICVGAAHVVGDGGMVDMLRNRGYTVELVK